MRCKGTGERCWQGPASCPDIGSKVVGTSAALEDQRGTGSDRDQSSWQGQGQHRLCKIVVQRCGHRMRRAGALVGQISGVQVDLEDNGLAGLEVAAAAANTVGMAPAFHLISISVPDSTHWQSLYP